MSTQVVVRGIAGPLNGRVRRLSGGDTWRVGSPPVLLLTSLGEGLLRVEPLRDGVRVDGRDVPRTETLAVGDTPRTLALPDGTTLWLARAAAPAACETAPVLALDLDEPAPIAASRAPRWRPPRSPLRLPRLSPTWRVSRAVGTSLAVHAALALALFLLLTLAPTREPERPRVVHVGFAGATDGDGSGPGEVAAPAEEPRPGDLDDADASSTRRFVDDLAAALDAEAGRGAEDVREADANGVGWAPSGDLLALRRGGRERLLREAGGGGGTQDALSLALDWLARHQSLDGAWDARAFGAECRTREHCAGSGDRPYRAATTALALLPFLGAGHTHLAGPWRETIRDGLAALVRLQRDDGSFADHSKAGYASAMAALALAEAYGLTGSETLRDPARRAARYFVDRQSPQGGWRYRPGDGRADTSVTGWVTLALVSARRAGLDVPARTLYGCRRWLGSQSADDGLVGYTGKGRGTDALLGVGLLCRHLLGADAAGPELAPIARRLAGRRPQWPADTGPSGYGVGDPMHWYYGSLAAFQSGGDAWLLWEPRLREMLPGHQEREGCAAGSWDPVGSTGWHGGRVVTTALCALCLEVTYRYPRAMPGR